MTKNLKARDIVTAVYFSLGVYAGWNFAKIALAGVC